MAASESYDFSRVICISSWITFLTSMFLTLSFKKGLFTYNHTQKSAPETTFCESYFGVDFCLMLCKSLWSHQINSYYKSLSWHIMWIVLSHWFQFWFPMKVAGSCSSSYGTWHCNLNNCSTLLASNHHFLPPLLTTLHWTRSALEEKGDYMSSYLCQWK